MGPPPSLTALAAAVLRLSSRPERILEIGCGDGERVLFLAREFPSARVRGVDPAQETVRRAVSRVGLDPEGRVAFKRGRARDLPYPDAFFDLVTQVGGRIHPGELARVLRPGGQVVLVGAWRLLDWRLRGQGFESLESGEVEGEGFLLARLPIGDQAPE